MTRFFVRNVCTLEEKPVESLEEARRIRDELERQDGFVWAVVKKQVDEFEGVDIFKRIDWAINQLNEIVDACDNNRPCVIIGKPMTEEESKEWSDKFFSEF